MHRARLRYRILEARERKGMLKDCSWRKGKILRRAYEVWFIVYPIRRELRSDQRTGGEEDQIDEKRCMHGDRGIMR